MRTMSLRDRPASSQRERKMLVSRSKRLSGVYSAVSARFRFHDVGTYVEFGDVAGVQDEDAVVVRWQSSSTPCRTVSG
jgi:hypothetical protein